jgi:hypothetical protein
MEGNVLGGIFTRTPQPEGGIRGAVRGFGNFLQDVGNAGLRQPFRREEQEQQLEEQRKKAMAQDAFTVYGLLNDNKVDDALSLIDRRVQYINELGGDPSDTLELRGMIASGQTDIALQELGSFVTAAMENGYLAAPAQPEIVKGSEIVDGQVVQRMPDGSFRAIRSKGFEAAQEKRSLQRVSAVIEGEDRPTSLNYDPSTGVFSRQMPDGSEQNIPSSMVTQVSVQGAASDVLPPVRMDTLQAERDWIGFQSEELGRMITSIQADPTLAGVLGQARRTGQQTFGAIRDLGSVFGADGSQRASEFMLNAANLASKEVADGNMTESQFDRLFNDPNLSEIALFENTLAFTLARLRSPDGRLLSPIVNQSLQDAKITGFTSSADVINKLSQIQRQLDSRIEGLDRRMGSDQRPQQQQGGEISLDDLLRRYAP